MKIVVVLSLVLVAMSYGYGLGSIGGANIDTSSNLIDSSIRLNNERQRQVDRIQNSTNEVLENLKELQQRMQQR